MTSWIATKPIPAGQTQELVSKNFLRGSDGLMGWSFYPRLVEYTDGSKWEPQNRANASTFFGGTKITRIYPCCRHCNWK